MKFAGVVPAIALLAICACRSSTPAQVSHELTVAIATDKSVYDQGQDVGVTLTNQSGFAVHIWSSCPLALEKLQAGTWVRLEWLVQCVDVFETEELASGRSTRRTIPNDARSGLLQAGLYRIPFQVARAPLTPGNVFYSNEFSVVAP